MVLDEGGEARFLGQRDEKTGRWSLLIDYFGTKPLARIGQEEIDTAARTLCPNAGPATRKRHVYVPMCAVLNHASRKGWISAPHIRHPRVRTPETKFSTPDTLAKLLPHCAPPLRRLVMVITYTGLRLNEALRLDWDKNVALGRRTLVVGKTKNGDGRAVHIPEPLLIELSSVPEADRRGRLFHWSHKSHVHKPLRTACRRAGVEYLSPHQQGRHTYATWLKDYAGLDLKGIMDAGGWKSIQSVVRYLHTSPGQAAKAADKLPSVHNPCSSAVVRAKQLKVKAK